MNDDAALLRSYAEEGSEAAFAELVRRHLDLVYATALRRVGGDTHLAADIAQQVFTALARQANKLSDVTVLGAWLHTATRNASANTAIAEQRRKAREQAVLDPALAPDNPAPAWERLKPVLDAAIDELPAPDRDAVVLRFLERRPFGEVGVALKVSADAARMRTERALDKLRVLLAKRGITSTAAAVGAIVSGQPAVSAPAGLTAAVTAISLAAPAAGAGAAALLLASLMKFKTVTAVAAVLLAFGGGAYVGSRQQPDAPPAAPETPRHAQTIADLRKENLTLRTEIDQLKATNFRPAPSHAVAVPPAPPPATAVDVPLQIKEMVALQKANAVVKKLRQLSAARDQYHLEHGRSAPSIAELTAPDRYIKDFKSVEGEDYTTLSTNPGDPMTVTLRDGTTVGLDAKGTPLPLPRASSPAFNTEGLAGAMQKARRAYQAANNNARIPETESGALLLLPYFDTPQEAADFVDYLEAMKQAGLLPP